MLSCVEHEKSFITFGPDSILCTFPVAEAIKKSHQSNSRTFLFLICHHIFQHIGQMHLTLCTNRPVGELSHFIPLIYYQYIGVRDFLNPSYSELLSHKYQAGMGNLNLKTITRNEVFKSAFESFL